MATIVDSSSVCVRVCVYAMQHQTPSSRGPLESLLRRNLTAEPCAAAAISDPDAVAHSGVQCQASHAMPCMGVCVCVFIDEKSELGGSK